MAGAEADVEAMALRWTGAILRGQRRRGVMQTAIGRATFCILDRQDKDILGEYMFPPPASVRREHRHSDFR